MKKLIALIALIPVLATAGNNGPYPGGGGGSVTATNINNATGTGVNLSGTFTGNGGGLTNLQAGQLVGGIANLVVTNANFQNITGNGGGLTNVLNNTNGIFNGLVYVDGVTGNNTTGNGTVTQPYADPFYALTVAGSNATIVVNEGNFVASASTQILLQPTNCVNFVMGSSVTFSNYSWVPYLMTNQTVNILGGSYFGAITIISPNTCSNVTVNFGSPGNPVTVTANRLYEANTTYCYGDTFYSFLNNLTCSSAIFDYPNKCTNFVGRITVYNNIEAAEEVFGNNSGGYSSTVEINCPNQTYTQTGSSLWNTYCKVIFDPGYINFGAAPSATATNTILVFRDVECNVWPTNLQAAGVLYTNSFAP